MTAAGRVVCILSEQWTLVSPRELDRLVDMAREVEQAGVDAVMLSEHVVLGPSADADGRMANERDYALPGNQDPAMPWPDSMVLLSAMAAATERVRLVAGAIISPLRHALVWAKQLATLDVLSRGRLVVQPTVSWHRDEYDALGVPFSRRGAILDEQLAAWERVWADSPASFHGEFVDFDDVWVEPKPWSGSRPTMWFGGSSVHDALLRRLVAHGDAFHPLGAPDENGVARLRAAMREAGRDPDHLEMVGGIRGKFASLDEPAPLEPALATIPQQVERGFTTICVKPSQFTDDAGEVADVCARVVAAVDAAVGG